MLNRHRVRRAVAIPMALAAIMAATLMTVVYTTPAAAEECVQYVEISPGVWGYVNVCEEDGDDGDDGNEGGGETEPECYLGRQDSFNYDVAYCEGELSCYLFIPPPTAPDEEDWPEPDPGTPENAVYANRACFTQPPEEALRVNEYVWIEPPEPSWPDEALQAYGELVAPEFELAFNPPRRSFVNLDTWFWAEGATDAELTGTSAAGLVAIATPERLEVEPGDDSDRLTCEFAVSKGDACVHVYQRASVNGTASVQGTPAYDARARLVYSVRFELNGEVMEIDGVPTQFESEWSNAAIPVAEIQAIVE